MIYSITLNPALDRMIWVSEIKADDTNRIIEQKRFAGGKGVDVSKVLTELGIHNTALGFSGGFAGDELEGRLINKGVACDFVHIANETRTNIVVNDAATNTQTVYSEAGPRVHAYELLQLIRKIEKHMASPEFVVISGSLPPGLSAEVYHRIVQITKEKGARVLLDCDGEALKIGIKAMPDVIKPNRHELSRLVDRPVKSVEDVLRVAPTVLKMGVKIILASMGAQGIVLCSADEAWHAAPPTVEVVNTVGAGDSALAGFIYGLHQKASLKEAIVFSVAAGTATTLQPGTALCKRVDFDALTPQVKVVPLTLPS